MGGFQEYRRTIARFAAEFVALNAVPPVIASAVPGMRDTELLAVGSPVEPGRNEY